MIPPDIRRQNSTSLPLSNSIHALLQANPILSLHNQACNVASKIHVFITEHKHIFFFAVSTLFASLSYPHIFAAGIPIGLIGGFLVGNAMKTLVPESSTYVYKKYYYEAAIALFTLAQVSAVAKITSYLNRQNLQNFGYVNDGIIPSIASGMITGVFIMSLLQDTYNKLFT